MSMPAIIMIVLMTFGALTSAVRHGRTTTENFHVTAVSLAVHIGLLYWGGFFASN